MFRMVNRISSGYPVQYYIKTYMYRPSQQRSIISIHQLALDDPTSAHHYDGMSYDLESPECSTRVTNVYRPTFKTLDSILR